jgi:outer membrane protein assembly factor BamA
VRAKFPSIETQSSGKDSVSVTATVDEGKLYRWGRLTVHGGEGLDEAEMLKQVQLRSGHPADLSNLGQRVGKMESRLRGLGYLGIRSARKLSIHDDTQLVDVDLQTTLGRQCHFGELRLEQMPVGVEEARKLWKLQRGDLMNQNYAETYVWKLRLWNPMREKALDLSFELASDGVSVDVLIKVR